MILAPELADIRRMVCRRSIDQAGHPVRLAIDDWIKAFEQYQLWCKDNSRPVLSSDEHAPLNFIWAGVPVVAVPP